MDNISPSGFTVSLTCPRSSHFLFYTKSCSQKFRNWSLFFIKRLQYRCFPVNTFVKCFKTPILKHSCERLLLRLTVRSHRRDLTQRATLEPYLSVLNPGFHLRFLGPTFWYARHMFIWTLISRKLFKPFTSQCRKMVRHK